MAQVSLYGSLHLETPEWIGRAEACEVLLTSQLQAVLKL